MDLEEIGRNLELFNRLFASQGLNQIRTFLERYDAQAMANLIGSGNASVATVANATSNGGYMRTDSNSGGGGNEFRGRDFESMIRKNVHIHSDVRQMILLFGKLFCEEI